MGDFEVSLTFNIRAEDRFDAAERVYTLIEAAPPKIFWVMNEGGVGDEVRIDRDTPMREACAPHAAEENLRDLAEELYRLGVEFGAGSTGESEAEHRARVDDVKKRLLAAFPK